MSKVMKKRATIKRLAKKPTKGSDWNLKGWLSDFSRSPTVKKVAAGLAVTLMEKVNSGSFPEFSKFLRENFPELEKFARQTKKTNVDASVH